MSARQLATESSEEEYFSVRAHHDHAIDSADSSDTDQGTSTMSSPRHPVSSMQGAFEESIYESSEPNPQLKSTDNTAESRRQRVLEVDHYDDTWTARWKQKPSARHHPLVKLMAQIVFGMHLLHQQAAKSDEEVVKILQTHVDEVDNFLEKTTDDFDLAIKDIAERIRFLKLPMSHPDVFGKMLEDKQFRTQLMEGNDKIENIIERTSRAMNAAVLDMQKGKAATKELGYYLNSVSDDWPGEKQDLEAVLTAMRGNEQGWKHCYKDLQAKSLELRDDLDELSTVIREMARMASAASRRARAQGRASSAAQSPMSTAIPRSKFNSDNRTSKSRPLSDDKPLPVAPLPTDGPVELEAHPIPMERRYEHPRPTPASPTHSDKLRAQRSSTVPPRPSTSSSNMEPREARNRGRNSTQDIVEFLQEAREPSPLRSNPPDNVANRPRAAKNPNRHSAIDIGEHAKALSALDGSRPGTSNDGASAPSYIRRNSDTQHTQMNPHRVGIERNKDGPPPSGRRESSIGPRFMRRLSFRSRKASQSPPPSRGTVRAASPRPSKPITPTPASRKTSFTNHSRPTFSQTNSNNKLAPAAEVIIQRATTPHLRPPSTTQPQAAAAASEPPSTPSAASGRSTTNSPSFTTTTATTPGTDTTNLSPSVKAPTNSGPDNNKPTLSSSRPNLADRRISSNNALNANGYGGNANANSHAPQQPVEEKKRSRGMSLRRFFGGSSGSGSSSKNAAAKERPPRAAMTYGDLA